LAAIAAVTPTESARLLRPLLGVPKPALEAMLRDLGQDWIEDPSNRNTAFARERMRALLPALGEAGVSPDMLADFAAQAGGLRRALDDNAAELCARAASLSPAGFARLDRDALSRADTAIGRRVLDRVLRTIGGSVYPPRGDRLDRLWAEMRSGLDKRRSLGGCLVTPSREGWLVQREPAGMAPPVSCRAGETVRWDGRFSVTLSGRGRARLGALGQKGWLAVKSQVDPGRIPSAIPPAVAPTLPALLDETGNPAVIPHLHWEKRGFDGLSMVDLAFVPNSPLTGGLVWHPGSTMC
jgi:tRNA(Ile)-lysidine synthase